MSQYDEISILAGGYSALRYDVNRLPGWVIGVNSSSLYARCDAAISMDRLWTEWAWTRLISLRIPVYLRDAALKNISPNWPGYVTRFACDYTSSVMTDEPNTFNGTNSGLCAVNLAYQLRPNILRLYGMDLCKGPRGEKHWYADYPYPNKIGGPIKGTSDGTFARWKRDLDHALRQCREVGIKVEVMTAKKVAA